MSNYKKVLNQETSNAGGFTYKINEVNIATHWNPKANKPKDFGGFNFSTEDKIIRWLLRGDTIYDVELPEDAEVIECENKNAPHGVFRTNKIILKNPKTIDESMVMDLYEKSDLPENSYFQCLSFLSLKNYDEVCEKIIKDKINKENQKDAYETFRTFIEVKEKDQTETYKKVLKMLKERIGDKK